jgi:hypothetical protein
MSFLRETHFQVESVLLTKNVFLEERAMLIAAGNLMSSRRYAWTLTPDDTLKYSLQMKL